MLIRIILKDVDATLEVEVNSFEELAALADKHDRWEYV